MENQIIQINLVPNLSTPAVVRVSQYDVGRPLVFKVYDGTSPADLTGVTAVVEGTKKSGLGFSESGTVSGNAVTLDTTLAMTQEDGMIPAEIRFTKTGEDVGTANFILAVEKTPHADGTTDGTHETMADLETRLQGQIDDLSDRIDDIEAGGSGLTQTEKNLILELFSKAAYAEDDASTAYDALENLWATTTRTITYNLSQVSSSNTTASIESGQSYTTTLTASTDYTLNTVTVTMGGVDITSTSYSSGTVSIPSVTGNIVITATAVLAAQSITATYTQSGTVYDTDSLDSLKADLVVTANYSGGTSETVPSTDYTLSGTLTVGTSTITVTYAGLTDTFSVTVSQAPLVPSAYQQVEYIKSTGTQYILTSIGATDKADYTDTNSVVHYSADIDFQFDEWVSAKATNIFFGFGSSAGNWIGYNNSVQNITLGTTSGTYFTDSQPTVRHSYHYEYDSSKHAIVTRDDSATIQRTNDVVNSATRYLQIFNVHNSNDDFYFNGKMYSVKVYKDSVKVLDLVPCYRKADSVMGAYDTVNDTFYTNSGTGTFEKGSDV